MAKPENYNINLSENSFILEETMNKNVTLFYTKRMNSNLLKYSLLTTGGSPAD